MVKSGIGISSGLVVDLAEEERILVSHARGDSDDPSLLDIAIQILEMHGDSQVQTFSSVEESRKKCVRTKASKNGSTNYQL